MFVFKRAVYDRMNVIVVVVVVVAAVNAKCRTVHKQARIIVVVRYSTVMLLLMWMWIRG